MKRIVQVISWLALAVTILPSVVFLSGKVDLDHVKVAMLVATVVWFVVTPLWMGRKERA